MAVGHPAEGTLRAYIDGELPAAERADLERHVASCDGCRRALADLRADASWASVALGSHAAPAGEVATAEAWRRVAAMTAAPAAEPAPRRIPARRRSWRWAAGAGIAAAVVLAAAAVPPVRAAAGDFLQIFRVQRVQVVTLTPADLAQIRSALASGRQGVDIRGIASVQVVPANAQPIATTLATAARTVDFPLTAPAGYSPTAVTLQPSRVIRLTLHAAGINALLRSVGSTQQVPAALDGKLVTLSIPDAVRIAYPGFSVLETVSPELQVPQGVDAAGLRQLLLDLPFLPQDLRAQLAAIQDWQDTAVLPDVSGASQAVSVGGAEGVFVGAGSRGGSSALIWLAGGVVHAITGPVTLAQAQAVAAAMR